ncbi:alpha/beta fold hydrolase [Kitasatospora sp. NPDC051853]|uniref:alpha/beta fold hydrolase n=1 Tax=Kitasatospora sp. NPDC051853 TaxID=3364058 RepID=UPI0037ABB290
MPTTLRTTELHLDGPAGRLAVLDHGGPGPDVLLLHGATRTALDWEPLRPHLPGLRLTALDLRGHGRSEGDGDYGWPALLADLDAVIAALGLRTPWLVGHSLGGMLAVRYAATRPGAVRGLVDLDGFGPGVPSLYPGLSATEVTERRAEQLALFASHPAEPLTAETCASRARARAAQLGTDPGAEVATALRARADDGTARPTPAELPSLMAPLDGWDMFAEARALTCPALFVRGAVPPTVGHLPPRQAELTTALVAGIDRELATLPHTADVGAGHLLHLERPAETARLIREFIG